MENLSKPLFGQVGIEPTFFPLISFPDFLEDDEDFYAGVRSDIYRKFEYFFEKERNSMPEELSKWIEMKQRNEANVMEIPTPKQYESFPVLLKEYRQLVEYLEEKCGYHPSSVVDREVEGGCHINISLSALKNIKTDKKDFEKSLGELTKQKNRFNKNAQAFLNIYPAFVWMNLAPNDNESSRIFTGFYKETNKGQAINLREKRGNEYLELRFFEMPENSQEFVFNMEIANNFMHHIYKITFEEKKNLEFVNGYRDLENFDEAAALKNATEALKILEVELPEEVKEAKFSSLKERIVYGKKYLV